MLISKDTFSHHNQADGEGASVLLLYCLSMDMMFPRLRLRQTHTMRLKLTLRLRLRSTQMLAREAPILKTCPASGELETKNIQSLALKPHKQFTPAHHSLFFSTLVLNAPAMKYWEYFRG